MRILHVITRFLPGGAEEKTLLEIENLRSEHDYALASGSEVDSRMLARLEGLGVPHIPIPALRHYAPWTAPMAVRQLRRAIARGRYDLVHTHSTEAGLLAREAAHRERVPRIVHTIHGHEFTQAHAYPIRRSVVAFHRHLARFTHRYFSNAESLVHAFLGARIGTSDQYALVRSGLDLGAVDQASASALRGRPVILSAARITRSKGLEEVIDAVGLLRKEFTEIRLAVAGDGPRLADLRRRVESVGAAAAVDFLGHRSDLPGLLKSADVFVHASHREGTPRVITQALAAGCPVVATNVDGIPEQLKLGEAGLMVPPRDVPALVAAIRSTLLDPAAARRRTQAGKEHVREFSLETMLSQLRSQYASLLPSAKPS